MLNKHEVFTTEESNRLLLPSGRITVNRDNWGIRVHDGEVIGGYEIPVIPAIPPTPGSQELIAGDETTGYFGELESDSIITGSDLATQVGLSTGTEVNNTSGWLKFILDRKILFVAKKPFRRNLRRDNLLSLGIVYGETVVDIGPWSFKVRLLTGVGTPITNATDVTNYDDPVTHGSEWNRLMYPITAQIPNSQSTVNWENFSADDLGFSDGGNHLTTITQDIGVNRPDYHVYRSRFGDVSYLHLGTFSGAPNDRGWRPVLELIS